MPISYSARAQGGSIDPIDQPNNEQNQSCIATSSITRNLKATAVNVAPPLFGVAVASFNSYSDRDNCQSSHLIESAKSSCSFALANFSANVMLNRLTNSYDGAGEVAKNLISPVIAFITSSLITSTTNDTCLSTAAGLFSGLLSGIVTNCISSKLQSNRVNTADQADLV